MTERPTPRAQQRTARVPDGRAERIARLAGLAAGIAGESALELLRRATGAGERGGSLLMTSANSARVAETLATALEEGMRTLKMDGIEKVMQGVTDFAQVRAVCIK